MGVTYGEFIREKTCAKLFPLQGKISSCEHMCNLKDQNITMYFLELNIKIPFLVGVSLGGQSGWLGLVAVVA